MCILGGGGGHTKSSRRGFVQVAKIACYSKSYLKTLYKDIEQP